MSNLNKKIFLDKFGFGVVDSSESQENIIEHALNSVIVLQPTFSEKEAIQYRSMISGIARISSDESESKVRGFIKEIEKTRYDKYIHIANTNQIHAKFTDFWSNHLCISDASQKLVMLPFLAQYESEIITPNIFGKFQDMLYASAKSAGMLLFLNNLQNIDPESVVAKRRPNMGLDINENYARELLELHTLSVDSNYSQYDVTSIAYLLSGWSPKFKDIDPSVVFMPERVSSRKINIFGKEFESGREDTLWNITEFLANHPSTIRYITSKMITYFISEKIDNQLHSEMIKIWEKTNGDLRSVSMIMMKYKRLNDFAKYKVRSPHEWVGLVIKTLKVLLGEEADYSFTDKTFNVRNASPLQKTAMWCTRSSKQMGQHIWGMDSPKGWDLKDKYWLSADSMAMKLDLSYEISEKSLMQKVSKELDLHTVLTIFPDLSVKTTNILADIEPEYRLSVLFLSPEILRR